MNTVWYDPDTGHTYPTAYDADTAKGRNDGQATTRWVETRRTPEPRARTQRKLIRFVPPADLLLGPGAPRPE